MKQLKSMKYEDNNCEKLQRLFTIIEEVGAEQMDQKSPSTLNPGKNNDSKSNARSEQIPKK